MKVGIGTVVTVAPALLPDHAPVVTAGVPVNEPSGTGALSAVILAASNV